MVVPLYPTLSLHAVPHLRGDSRATQVSVVRLLQMPVPAAATASSNETRVQRSAKHGSHRCRRASAHIMRPWHRERFMTRLEGSCSSRIWTPRASSPSTTFRAIAVAPLRNISALATAFTHGWTHPRIVIESRGLCAYSTFTTASRSAKAQRLPARAQCGGEGGARPVPP